MKSIAKILVISVIGIILCSGTLTVSAIKTQLIVGQEEIDGFVHVKRYGEEVKVIYNTEGTGWEITEIHFALGASLDDIPTNKKGNPKIGHFPYSYEFPEGTTYHEFWVPLADYFPPGVYRNVDVYFAAHAVVTHPDYGEETAWADTYGIRFTENNWALYCIAQGSFTIPA